MKKIVISIIALVYLWTGIWGITEIVFSNEETNTGDVYYEYTDEELANWYMNYIGKDVEHIFIKLDESYDCEGYFKIDYFYVNDTYTDIWYGGSYVIGREYCIDNMFS